MTRRTLSPSGCASTTAQLIVDRRTVPRPRDATTRRRPARAGGAGSRAASRQSERAGTTGKCSSFQLSRPWPRTVIGFLTRSSNERSESGRPWPPQWRCAARQQPGLGAVLVQQRGRLERRLAAADDGHVPALERREVTALRRVAHELARQPVERCREALEVRQADRDDDLPRGDLLTVGERQRKQSRSRRETDRRRPARGTGRPAPAPSRHIGRTSRSESARCPPHRVPGSTRAG